MLSKKLEFEGITGVGKVALELEHDQRVYTFIGANGVGKTKTLEALFQVHFFSNEHVKVNNYIFKKEKFRFSMFTDHSLSKKCIDLKQSADQPVAVWHVSFFGNFAHTRPVVYLGAQSRGLIKHERSHNDGVLGNLTQRRRNYFSNVVNVMDYDFSSMGMENNIEDWFVTLARSSNPYQKKEDNRDVEIKTVIQLLHQIDSRIDPEFLEISGDDRVSLKIEGQKRELSQLSSGFTSILKLIQAIVSGYGYFTNEVNLQRVKGIVLIDEIESHLHLTWQANIIPLLKKLFPNTTFYITTHSSIVLSQLQEGEAYTLYRDDEGIVQTRKIASPNKAALVDIMKDVFQVDLNQMKLDNSQVEEQKEAKESLLALLRKEAGKP